MIRHTLRLLNTAPKPSLTLSNHLAFSQQQKQPKKAIMIKVNVEINNQVKQFAFKRHTKLAKNLQDAGVPLPFDCGFSCSCGTCACTFQPQDFKRISADQPIGQTEKSVMKENQYGPNVRLTCQLFVMDYFENMKIKAST